MADQPPPKKHSEKGILQGQSPAVSPKLEEADGQVERPTDEGVEEKEDGRVSLRSPSNDEGRISLDEATPKARKKVTLVAEHRKSMEEDTRRDSSPSGSPITKAGSIGFEKRLSRRSSTWGGSAKRFSEVPIIAEVSELSKFDESRQEDSPRGSAGENISGAEEDEETENVADGSNERKSDALPLEEGEDDFNQDIIEAAKADDEEMRGRGSWGADLDEGESPTEDDDDVGGGMQDLLGRSEAAKEEQAAKEQKELELKKRKRKRRQSLKDPRKDRDRKFGKTKKKTPEEEAKEREKLEAQSKVWVEPQYNSEDFVSPPLQTEDSHVPDDILKFYESYGYDSERRDNLQMIDEDTLMFISGNYLHFYSVKERKVKEIQRAAVGYGLGHIAIHPSRKYFAVGEKGLNPIVAIYTWPGREIYRVLRKGTTKGYASLNFNLEGQYLCSQGMDPDYMLTIWDWEHEKTLLRCKSYSQDIFKATFNPSNPGDLVTCGVGHIRFWRMAETFTGLKLQGAIGRFGKTEISDMEDYVELSDGKILSGCEWGSILVWDGGLIVCEIRQPENKTLHDGEITALSLMETGELITVGKDGYLKMWDSETIDVADTVVGDSGLFETEPIHELKLSVDAKLLGVLKNIGGDPSQNLWLVQDGWGRVWDVNLTNSMTNSEYTADTVLYCPGGGINDIAVSNKFSVMVVGTSGGHMWLMEYINKECLAKKHYKNAVTKLIWLPLKYDSRGVTFIAGFADGQVRNFSIQLTTPEQKDEDAEDPFTKDQPYEFSLNQILRYATGGITLLKIDEENDILYICGEDRTLWACSLYWDDAEDCPVMEPLAYVTAPFPVVCLDLHPNKDYRMIIASKGGRVAECRKPDWLELDSSLTFNQGKLHGRRWWYKSVKGARRKMERKEARKVERERRLALLKEDIMRRKEAGLVVEAEIEIGRLSEEFRKAQQADDDEPLYVPEKPCPVLAIYYHINKNIAEVGAGKSFFVHVGDYDAGYIYECKCTKPDVGGFHPVPPTPHLSNDVGVRSYIVSYDDEFLLFGMEDGSIRVMPQVDVNEKLEEMRKKAEAKKKQEAKDKKEDDDDEDDEEEEDQSWAAQKKAAADSSRQAEAEKKKKADNFQMSIFPYDLENFFALPMHDPNRGAVNALAWSHDGKFLFSVGADGSIFSYRWDPAGSLESATDSMPTPTLPPDEPLGGDFLLDSEEATANTVEEMRAKEEDDRVHGMSEQAKEDVRRQLREMKAIYRSIKQRNMEIPEQFRIPNDDLKLPREIYAHIQKKVEIDCDEVYRIHEYESAETIVQLDKIRNFYIDPIDTPSIIIKDISHILQTHTIRNRKVTKEFQDLVEKNKEILEEENRILNAKGEKQDSDMKKGLPPIKRYYAKDIIGEYDSKIDTYDVETMHNIRHLEKRLEQRYNRECAWQELMAKKISPDYIPPEDEEALASAKADTGAFRLQTSESFLGEQISLAERRQRIIDMKIKMRGKVVEFNKMIIEARDEKPKILIECRNLEKEIRKIHVLLPDEYRRKIPPIYDMEADETPESMLDITPEDVEAEENSMLAAAGLLSIKDDILEEFFGIKKPEKSALMNEEDDKTAFVPPPAATAARQAKVVDLEFESVASHRCRKCYFSPQTDLEKKRFEVQFYPRLYRQEMLFNDLLRIIGYYHERIKYLHDFRIQLEIESKVQMVGLITMISELDIAKEFDAQEKAILERLRAQQAESKDAKHHMDKIQRKLVKCHAEQKRYESELLSITKEVDNLIGGKGRFSDYLWRVFKKKVRIEVVEEEEASEAVVKRNLSTSSDSSDSSESTSQDSGSDLYKLPKQKMDINTCPEHLDRNIYNKICELRQRKLTLEQEVDGHKKTAEKVSAEFLEIEKVYHKYEGRIGDISEEIRVLQRRRQKRMNDLKLMVILRADQIQCMDMDDIADMDGDVLDKLAQTFPGTSSIIIFPKGGSEELEKRSGELNKKARDERERYKKGRQMLVRLREELKKSEKQVEVRQGQVKKEMVLKFGQEVDLDKITAVIINLELLDNEILLDKMKNEQYKERERVNREVDEVKYQLTQKIKENSKCNMMKAMMLERRRDLEYYIWKNENANIDAASILQIEAGGGDVAKQIQTISRATDSFLTATSSQQLHIFNNGPLEEEMENVRRVLKKQTERIGQLKDVLRKCRTKSGLPPLIKISEKNLPTKMNPTVPMYMKTTRELPALNQYCKQEVIQCGVQTIYKGNITPSLRKSDSFTQASLENVDEIAESETNKILGEFSEMNYDYSSGEENEVPGGAAAVREFQEAISEMLPDEEEAFMEYLENAEMLGIDEMEMSDMGTMTGDKRSTPTPSSADKSGSSSSGHKHKREVKFTASGVTIDDDGTESIRSTKSKKSTRARKASRKSYLAIAQAAKSTTDAQVMEKVRRFSHGTELSREEQNVIDGVAAENIESNVQAANNEEETEKARDKKHTP